MVDYWHGGRRGRHAGDYLLSPNERRHEMSADERFIDNTAVTMGYNTDRGRSK